MKRDIQPCGTCARVRNVLPRAIRERLEKIQEDRLRKKRNAKPQPAPAHHD